MRVYSIPLRTRFRGIDVREGVLIDGPEGWGEFSPFLEYADRRGGAVAALRGRGRRRRVAARRCGTSCP